MMRACVLACLIVAASAQAMADVNSYDSSVNAAQPGATRSADAAAFLETGVEAKPFFGSYDPLMGGLTGATSGMGMGMPGMGMGMGMPGMGMGMSMPGMRMGMGMGGMGGMGMG